MEMLSRRIAAARPLSSAVRSVAPRTTLTQLRFASENNANKENFVGEMAVEDIGMNGGYVNPPAVKRAFRDPYGDWWDKQERRNFGEPVHEDNDTLGIFSTEPYTHFQPGHGAVLLGTFIASVFVLMGVVRQYYPDKASVPRTFPGGLDRELGGAGAVPASHSSLLSNQYINLSGLVHNTTMNEETYGILKRLQGQDLATLWINSTSDDVAEIEVTLRAYHRLLRLLDQHIDDAPQTKMIEGAARADDCAQHEPLQLQVPEEPILRESGDVHQPGVAYEKVDATSWIVSLFAPVAASPLPVLPTTAEPLRQYPKSPIVRLPQCAPFRNSSQSRLRPLGSGLSRAIVRLPSPAPVQVASKSSEDHLFDLCSPALKRATVTRREDDQAMLDRKALTRAKENALWEAREEAAKSEILRLSGTLELKMKTIACRVSPEKDPACDQTYSMLESSGSLLAGRPSPQRSVEMLGSRLEPVPEHPRSIASSQTSSSPKLVSYVPAEPRVSWSSIWSPRDRANFGSATSTTATSSPMPVNVSTADSSVSDVPSPSAKSVSERPGSMMDQTITSTSLFSPVADSKMIKLRFGGPRELCPGLPSTPPYIENMSTDKWNEDCISFFLHSSVTFCASIDLKTSDIATMDDEESHRLILRLLNEDLVSIQASSRHSIHSDTFVAATLARQELRTAHQQINDLRTARIVSREEVSQREAVRANEISARLLFRQLNPDEPLPNPLTDHQMAIAEALDQSPAAIKAESNASPCPQPGSSALRSHPTTSFDYPRPSLKRSADDLIDAEVPPSKKHESDHIGIDVTLPGPSDTARHNQNQSQYQPIYFGKYQRGSLEHDRLSGVFSEMPVAPSPMSEQFKGLKRPAEEETPTFRSTKKQDSRHDIVQPCESDRGDATATSPLEISNTSEVDTMAEASHGFSFTSVRLAPFEYPTVSETQSSRPLAPFGLDAPLPPASPPRFLFALGKTSEAPSSIQDDVPDITDAVETPAIVKEEVPTSKQPVHPANQSQTNSNWAPKMTCMVCSYDLAFERSYVDPCGHGYCGKCINRLIKIGLRDVTLWPPSCCKSEMPIESIKHLLNPLFVPLVSTRQLEMNTPDLDRAYCAKCSVFISREHVHEDKATCISCKLDTCTKCTRRSHPGDCQTMLEESAKELDALAEQEGWKKCSNCHMIVEHNTGCNHME
ncbi:hypothetical protein D6D02_09165 [Aureobasidium pullulans]|nr:hypothetical protein D6D02_09165 [Aureobasidium pullulans]